MLNGIATTSGLRIAQGIPYGSEPRQVLDVYAPDGARSDSAQSAPVVVFLYGGAWQTGSRALYRFVGAALAERGFVTVIPDYRVYPQVQYPAFLQDCAQATAWASAHAAEHGGGSTLFVMGHSAGAYNAMMLALDDRWLGAAGLDARRLAGGIGLSGPYDFLPIRGADIRAVFGSAANDPSTQPINHVAPGAPKLFLGAGTGDTTVRPGNTERLAARVRAAGDSVTLRLYPGLGHIITIAAFAAPLRWTAPTLSDVTAYLRQRSADAGR